LCGKYNTVPTSYKLEGVEKDGDLPQCIHPAGRVTEIWRGRHNGKVVALKIITPLGESQVQEIKSVNILSVLLGGSLVVLTDGVAILQGSSVDEGG